MQLNLLELLLSQTTPSGGPFGLDRFPDATSAQSQSATETNSTLVDWLSMSISAARSLFGMILVLPPGEEGAVSNIGWISMQCALSLAVRLDLVAAYGSASESTRHLSRFLDMPLTLRHIVMRLESASSADVDATGDRDTFYQLAQRARRLESWYHKQHDEAKAKYLTAREEAQDNRHHQLENPNAGLQSMDVRSDAGSTTAAFSSVMNNESEAWAQSTSWYGDDPPTASMGEFLFSDLLQFPTDLGFLQSQG